MNNIKLAKLLYEEYCINVGGKAFNGDPLPNWEDFSKHPGKQVQVEAWLKLADSAMKHCNYSAE